MDLHMVCQYMCNVLLPSGDDADWKEESYPFNFGWGAGPVSPSMVQDWKEWSKQQTFLDGYTEDPRISGSIWSYKAMDPNNEGNVLADFRLDDSEPAYTVFLPLLRADRIFQQEIHQYQCI